MKIKRCLQLRFMRETGRSEDLIFIFSSAADGLNETILSKLHVSGLFSAYLREK